MRQGPLGGNFDTCWDLYPLKSLKVYRESIHNTHCNPGHTLCHQVLGPIPFKVDNLQGLNTLEEVVPSGISPAFFWRWLDVVSKAVSDIFRAVYDKGVPVPVPHVFPIHKILPSLGGGGYWVPGVQNVSVLEIRPSSCFICEIFTTITKALVGRQSVVPIVEPHYDLGQIFKAANGKSETFKIGMTIQN